MNEKKIDSTFISEKCKLWELKRLPSPKIVTAPNVGIDKRKDILAESNLLKFNNLAAVIVIPDLLTPGIKDNTWNNPIIRADL